jgi:hypothetical protein
MKMFLSSFPEGIVQKYHLNALAVDGWVYIEIRKGMYGLKQAGLLANQLLQTRLTPFGYYPARHTPGLWLHHTRPISFTLVVDDFAVKYVGKNTLSQKRSAENLLTDNGLGPNSILRHNFEMGLQKQNMRHFHAWLHLKRAQQIST